jgi:hypothetical protein
MFEDERNQVSITDVNNRAVDCLEHGTHSEAMGLLKGALQVVQQHVNLTYGHTGPQISALSDIPLCSVSIGGAAALNEKQEGCGMGFPNVFHFYNRAFRFKETQEGRQLSDESLDAFSVVLLYNIGLSHHARGLYNNCSHTLQVALNIYEMAMKIVNKSSMNGDSRQQILCLALLNNIGYLQAHFANIDKVRCCLAFIQGVLRTTPTATRDNDDAYSSEIQFFHENVFCFLHSSSDFLVSAPAA